MFTNPNYRRKGIAKELLSRVVNDARDYGCGTIQITASDMGGKLYTDFGFVHNRSECFSAAGSFIRTAQGRGFAILTAQKPISRQKQCFLGW